MTREPHSQVVTTTEFDSVGEGSNPSEVAIPYLIAHLVRGQPAFDIAEQMVCPECHGLTCDECERGYWWIIPTSGHRAYPWWCTEIKNLQLGYHEKPTVSIADMCWDNIPINSYPDHYPPRATPTTQKVSLIETLGLSRPQSPTLIKRRV